MPICAIEIKARNLYHCFCICVPRSAMQLSSVSVLRVMSDAVGILDVCMPETQCTATLCHGRHWKHASHVSLVLSALLVFEGYAPRPFVDCNDIALSGNKPSALPTPKHLTLQRNPSSAHCC